MSINFAAIKAGTKRAAVRYIESMAYADPTGMAIYPYTPDEWLAVPAVTQPPVAVARRQRVRFRFRRRKAWGFKSLLVH